MMRRSMMIAVAAVLVLTGCSEEPIIDDEGLSNLLGNPSFEQQGAFSLAGWSTSDTAFVYASTDVPPDGGHYSVAIDANWGLVHSVTATVPAGEGTSIYRLSAWGKAEGPAGGGSMALLVQRGDSLHLQSQREINDSRWHYYSISDTIAIQSEDKLLVRLSGGFNHLLAGRTKFDGCRLEIVK